MSSECTLGCALFMWLASVDVPVEQLHANKAPHGCIFPYLETSTEHRTEHFLVGGSNCCITFHTHEFLFLFPVGGGLFFSVRVLLNKEYRTPKWWICHAPPYPRNVQGNHCFGSCSWLSPQIPHLKTTFLTCEAKLSQINMSFIYYFFCYKLLKGYDSTKRVPKGFYATHSADVRITSFCMFNRIIYPLPINYRIHILYSDILYFDVRITSFRMFYRIMYPLRINY